MKNPLTSQEKKDLAAKAFRSVAAKADTYPSWMHDHFTPHFDAYNNALNR